MVQSSSISSFDARRYLRSFFAAIAGGLLLTGGLSWLGERFDLIEHWAYRNYHVQVDKLAQQGAVDTLFLGDSSLGTLLDIETWSDLRGAPGGHLALTANFGYAGSLNMLRRRLAHGHPRNVVIMHTAETLTQDVAGLGYLQTRPAGTSADALPLKDRLLVPLKFYFSPDIVSATLQGLWNAIRGTSSIVFDKGYIRTPAVTGAPGHIVPGQRLSLDPARIKPEKMRFLKRLASLCRTEGLNCIYAHGPIYEEVCRTSPSYFARAEAAIIDAGLAVVPGTPVCVPRDELANTLDHVRRDLKTHYTRRYFDLLRNHLR